MSAPEEIHVEGRDSLAPVVAAMAELTTAGAGWINLTPASEDPAPPQSVWGRLSGRGPTVPRITWTAPTPKRSRAAPAQLGIEQSTGKALGRLVETGHPLPPGWVRQQDHPMRGLVVSLPPDAEAEHVMRWALEAVDLLTGWAADARWRAQIYRG